MVTDTHHNSLTEARERRAHLRGALQDVELAVSSPAPGREEAWRSNVRKALRVLRSSLAQHIIVAEGPDGLLPQIETDAPRLENQINRLRADHGRLDSLIADALGATEDSRMTPDDVRLLVGAIHSALLRHRQAGSDLVYEAYEVDIGGGED